jgi:1-deoxy-D-xylulose-5-phosphate synthase
MYELLKNINGPSDLKKLNLEQLNSLKDEIREALFNRLTKIGGHFGPNFGIVEMTIALHYVFNSPVDKFVFDVSHQSYTHKMLTGRRNGYIIDECFSEDSGYTNPEESEHDFFNVGHTSTSISLATGLAKGRDILGDKENIIAIIGDGSLSGGEAMEGLNVAGSEINSNLIIIVNDNQQSISETHGGIYKNLELLRNTNGKALNNMFTAIGLDYAYLGNGNDIEALIEFFKKNKDIDHPIVLHINTKKGKGYKIAEENKEEWHWCMPFDRETGKPLYSFSGESYVDIAKKHLLNRANEDKSVVVVTPNMPAALGLSEKERINLGNQFVDCGIAEEQACAMASGIAKRGAHPVVVTNATFMKRTYDQVSHDICINNTPVTFLLNFCNFDGLTDVTHLGIFAISMFSNIPNLVIMAPSSKNELLDMMDYAIFKSNHPTMILLPGDKPIERETSLDVSNINKFEVTHSGNDVAIIALGDFYSKGLDLYNALKDKLNINPTLINPRFASGIDKELLDSLLNNHKLVITLEDGIIEGGFGNKIANYYSDKNIIVKSYGLDKKFYDRYNPKELLKELKMDTDSILNYVKETIGGK